MDAAETAGKTWECPSCGRVFDDQATGPCPVTDDCPSYFEERGLPAPLGA